jgi:hypothetical protein
MRIIALSIATVLSVCVATPVFAASTPTDAKCHALAKQRGSSEAAGAREHDRFIAQCMVGKIPLAGVAAVPVSTPTPREDLYEKCHALARERGSSETKGMRGHERFISQCMAGKIK